MATDISVLAELERMGVKYAPVDEEWVRTGAYLTPIRSEEHTSELQSRRDLVCRLLLEKKKLRLPNATRSWAVSGSLTSTFSTCDSAKYFLSSVTATTEIYTLSLHDALPILGSDGHGHISTGRARADGRQVRPRRRGVGADGGVLDAH